MNDYATLRANASTRVVVQAGKPDKGFTNDRDDVSHADRHSVAVGGCRKFWAFRQGDGSNGGRQIPDRSLVAVKIGGRGQWRVERAELERYIAGLYEAARSGPGPGPEAADIG